MSDFTMEDKLSIGFGIKVSLLWKILQILSLEQLLWQPLVKVTNRLLEQTQELSISWESQENLTRSSWYISILFIWYIVGSC